MHYDKEGEGHISGHKYTIASHAGIQVMSEGMLKTVFRKSNPLVEWGGYAMS